MKNFRLLAVILLASTLATFAPAQQSEDITALRAKAEKGNGLAQYNLGLAYAEGRGVAVDRLEAYVWLSLARENGARGRALDSLMASLDKASLQAAQQRLADQKAAASAKIPVVSTRQTDPDTVATVKTTGAAYLTPAPSADSQDAASLSQQIVALTADKKQLSEEVAKAWKEIDGLNASLSKTAKNGPSPNQPAASAADLESANKFNRELEASLSHANEEKSQLEQNLAAAQAEIERTKAELSAQAQKSEKLAVAEAARLTPSAEIATLRNQLSAAQTQSASLSADLTAVRASETKLHDDVAQLEQEKAQLSAKPTYPDLSGQVGELQAQLAQANRSTEAATQAAAASGKQGAADLSASAAEIARLQAALAEKPNAPSYPDLSGKVHELEATVADSAKKLSESSAAQSELQSKLADATASAKNAAKAGEETAQLRREHDELSGRVANLSSENTQLRADRERMQKLLADSGKQLRDSAADASHIKELESQTKNLQTSLGTANAQISTLQHSLAAKSDAPAYPDLSGKVRELETRLTATNQQADAAVQTAVNASKQSTADLNNAAARISQLEAELAAKPAPASAPDLSGRVQELEKQLADASAETARAKQEALALGKAKDEALKNRGPAYPNLAGRVVELQTALADTKHDLTEAQNALRAAEQARTAAPAAAVAATTTESAATTETTDLQKQLAETEGKLATALRGYALLQHDHDEQIENAAKSAEAVTTERNALATQVTALTAEVEQLKAGTSNQATAAQAEVAHANESLGALQRSTAQNSTELIAARALVQQLQGANTVLANENYQLKTKLSPSSAPTAPSSRVITPVAAPATARTHTIAAGDTLFRISQRYYGTPNRWQEIYKANTAKLGTNGVLRVGTELVIP